MTARSASPERDASPAELRSNYGIIAMIGAITIMDGYDVFIPAYVIHYVMTPWGISPAQAGPAGLFWPDRLHAGRAH